MAKTRPERQRRVLVSTTAENGPPPPAAHGPVQTGFWPTRPTPHAPSAPTAHPRHRRGNIRTRRPAAPPPAPRISRWTTGQLRQERLPRTQRLRAFNMFKHWRGLATRYDKHATVYRRALVLAATLAHRFRRHAPAELLPREDWNLRHTVCTPHPPRVMRPGSSTHTVLPRRRGDG
jgi:hypothetical protein